MKIPVYPEFAPLTLEHKDIFDAAFKENPPVISEFTFTNIYSWRMVYGFKAASLGSLIILRADSAKIPRFLPPIGSGDINPAVGRILTDTGGEFIRVPEQVAALLDADRRFKISEDAANADYLYFTSDLITLKGRKYDGKRNLIRKFKSNNSYRYQEINVSNVKQILDFEEIWCSIKDCEHVMGLANERKAIAEIISCFGRFALKAGVVIIDDKIRAVAIGEALNPQTFVVHMLKADPAITGLYQLINNEFLRACAAGFKYVNLEQDLGIPGIRVSKESYHPVEQIRKYSVSLRRLSHFFSEPGKGGGV